MFLNHILLGFLGIAFGGAVAAGTFAFVIVIGVVPPYDRKMQPCGEYTLL